MKKIICLGLISILTVVTILSINRLKLQAFQTECCHWSGIISNPYIDMTEEAWGQVGAVTYPTAAQWMRTHNGISHPLDETQKRYLRSYFGGLVDHVVVIYNAKLMDDWLYADFKIDIGLVDSIAQTYCERIYLEESYKPSDFGQLILLSHELVHSKQCKRFGGASNFGYYYFREFKRVGQIYENNTLEKEANEYERQFAGWLSNQIASN
ncbi:hypothetical protein WA1_00420 [Scytonema hofmannii PCC 7110]|uniref:DUF4157 domain-containing protein n=1 Tax=Scytonema hofmannii PCC 7110 TaxID=128403 RepID=A0A139XG53_9CYAN|nr:hypothetical protein [Scytonema hofmannii]KYC43670.1 hypothetical protein WA1_00420 [Scytonema hofmannii PCC 7110]